MQIALIQKKKIQNGKHAWACIFTCICIKMDHNKPILCMCASYVNSFVLGNIPSMFNCF